MNDKLSTTGKVMERRIVQTEDGSTSIEIPGMNEMYHSRKGAIKESQFVYIDHGFSLCASSPINVLEVGTGTGLNVVLTYLAQVVQDKPVHYHTLEPYPLNEDEWKQLNFNTFLSVPKGLMVNIHSAPENETIQLNDQFSFRLQHIKLEHCSLDPNSYDVVYFDAFAPNKQDSPWQISNIEKIFNSLKPGGILTTYCSQGQFKRNLAKVGFVVTNPEGPMGKREITVAHKPL